MSDKPALLLSYAYFKTDDFVNTCQQYDWREVIIDSGAWTAHTLGKQVHLETYTRDCKRVLAADPLRVRGVFSLDVIGDWRGSLANTEFMWKAGVPAIPVFHYGEPWDVLTGLARDYPKIGIGGIAMDHADKRWTAEDILNELVTLNPKCKNIIFTGGEPLLQLDRELVGLLKDHGYYLAIETNGSKELPPGVNYDPTGKEPNRLDWITCSPKVAEHAVRLKQASEVKYVRGYGQAVPRPTCQAEHQLISPAFDGTHLDQRAMAWCLGLIREHPEWRLSVQLHKSWMVR